MLDNKKCRLDYESQVHQHIHHEKALKRVAPQVRSKIGQFVFLIASSKIFTKCKWALQSLNSVSSKDVIQAGLKNVRALGLEASLLHFWHIIIMVGLKE